MSKWTDFAIRIQSLAQAGLYYGTGVYDIERYEELPEQLANEKTTKEQILMCFEANENENWQTMFD